MFVVNPDEYLLPSIRISPFKTEHIALNHLLPKDDFFETYLDSRFGAGQWSLTLNGREAIKIALEYYKLEKNDIVTILTTSENFYISSCVTREIEAVCKWSRKIVAQTKLVFVNHEFGYPHPEMRKLSEMGVPIIEDCCTAFFSQNSSERVGKYGDFALYSLPKFFPIQIGGVIVANNGAKNLQSHNLINEEMRYITNVLSYNIKHVAQILEKRINNYNYALTLFSRLGFTSRFTADEKIVPSVLLLKNNGIIKDLDKLKSYLSRNGVQSSVFYGEDAFFIPNHQSLATGEIDFLCYLVSNYLTKYNING